MIVHYAPSPESGYYRRSLPTLWGGGRIAMSWRQLGAGDLRAPWPAERSHNAEGTSPSGARGRDDRPVVVVIGTRGLRSLQGGVENYCRHLYPRLAARGARVIVFARRPYQGCRPFRYREVEVVPLPSSLP